MVEKITNKTLLDPRPKRAMLVWTLSLLKAMCSTFILMRRTAVDAEGNILEPNLTRNA